VLAPDSVWGEQLAAGTHHFMPTIIYQVAASMDGYIADADGGV